MITRIKIAKLPESTMYLEIVVVGDGFLSFADLVSIQQIFNHFVIVVNLVRVFIVFPIFAFVLIQNKKLAKT